MSRIRDRKQTAGKVAGISEPTFSYIVKNKEKALKRAKKKEKEEE